MATKGYEKEKILELFEAQKESWQKRVADGIEKYRKGTALLRLTDASGRAIDRARVTIKQKSHEFRFGANLFMLDELESEEKNERYKQYFADVFNMATLPFYWDTLEPEYGRPRYGKDSPRIYRRPPIDLCIEFCEKHGIEPREHALAYDIFFPKWLYGADTPTVKRELERRFGEISERYADKIRTIEVTNEMEWEKGRTDFYDDPDFVRWCFALAEKYFPENQLCINDHTPLAWRDRCRATDKYYSYIEANMLKGARIDAIGAQYHLFHRAEDIYRESRQTLNPESLYAHLDLYANFGKPLQITEVTVPAYSWHEDDEDVQAKILEALYSIWFSHPNVEQIIYWNLVDGYAHLFDADLEKIKKTQGDMTVGENYYHGGLIRFDMTPKPSYQCLKDLICRRWHTEEVCVTNQMGQISFRGFYGTYDLVIEANGKTYQKEAVLSSGKANEISLRLDDMKEFYF